MKHILLSFVAFMLLSCVALAGEVTHIVRIPLHYSTADGTTYYSQSWYDVIQVPPFDTSLGTLTRVEFSIHQLTHFQFFYENLSPGGGRPVTWERISSKLVVRRVGYAKDLAKAVFVHNFVSIISGPGDGMLDWDGSGGYTSPIMTRYRRAPSSFRMDVSVLNYFSQANVYLDVYGSSRFRFISYDGWWAMGMHHHNGAELGITYFYS